MPPGKLEQYQCTLPILERNLSFLYSVIEMFYLVTSCWGQQIISDNGYLPLYNWQATTQKFELGNKIHEGEKN